MSHTLLPIPAVHLAAEAVALPPSAGPGLHEERGTVLAAVNAWHAQGAHWIHLLDDVARAGSGDARGGIGDVVHHHRGSLHFQLAGGIVDEESLAAALATGVTRVVIDVGSAPDRQWVVEALSRHGERVAAGLDAHGIDLVDAGGARVADLFDTVLELEASGCPRYVVTEAARRGHWRHENTHVLAGVCESVRHPVVAHGGVTHLNDVHELAELTASGLEAVIIDEPLYSGRFTFAEAAAAGEPRYDPYHWVPPQP